MEVLFVCWSIHNSRDAILFRFQQSEYLAPGDDVNELLFLIGKFGVLGCLERVYTVFPVFV